MQDKRLTCLGSGGLSFDIVTEREYPEGYSKQKTYSDHILLQEAGGACGNLMSFLSYYGWETYPVARIDTSLIAKQLIADLNRYGVDTRFIFQHIMNDTPVIQYRLDTDKEGKRHVINKKFCSDGRFHRFRPAVKFITKQTVNSDILKPLEFTPDVFYMGHLCPGVLHMAKELKEMGSLVLTDMNAKLDAKKTASFLKASDIIACRPGIDLDINAYSIDWTCKLIIQVDADFGIRYNLFGKGWTVLRAVSFEKVDEEGGMEWLLATFLKALSVNGSIHFPSLDCSIVSSALVQAQEQAIQSMALLGAKSIIYQDESATIPPSTFAEDILCVTDEIKEAKKHGHYHELKECYPLNPHGIMGAICGDILGSYYEFHATKSVNFQLFPPQSRWTDDTAMTIALARWLMGERTSENLIRIMVEIGRKYPNAGFGGRFKRWLHSEDHPSMGSLGNGSAMRVSPVGLIADSLEEALSLAEISARVSHDHQEGIQGAQAVAAAIYLTRTGSSKQEIKEYISRTFGYDLNRTCDEIRPTYKFESGCAKSVPEAIICWLESDTYEETVRKAISLGGDADTMACIAGSIAAATPSMGVPDFILQRGYRYLEKEFTETVWAFDHAWD